MKSFTFVVENIILKALYSAVPVVKSFTFVVENVILKALYCAVCLPTDWI